MRLRRHRSDFQARTRLLRHAAEVVDLFAAEAGHERHSGGGGAVELAEHTLDSGVDLIAMGNDVLTYGSVNDVLFDRDMK